MMREVLGRRFARARQEQERLDRDEPIPVKWAVLPDLIVLDGGRGQLGAARDVLFEYNQAIPAVALAKQQELIYVPDLSEPIALPRDSHGLQLLQRLRDEAHRFAIGSHRARRKRDLREAGLQEIPGIGPTRKRALLRHFGTLRAIERAAVADLEQVPGINAETARKVYDFFHQSLH